MSKLLIKNVTIVNDNKRFVGNVLIENECIKKISADAILEDNISQSIDGTGKFLLPGMIDDQVHFREPGLTHKGTIHSGSRAAVAGGITSFMEMPNTVPNTVTQDFLEEKYQRAAETSLANYSFYFGATNNNLDEVLKTNKENVCGIKVFMGSSTGNMLVDNKEALSGLFSECELLIASHCEDEETVQYNLKLFKAKYGDDIPMKCHPQIRSEEACYKSSSMAAELAAKHGAQLHILHISTEKETHLFRNDIPLSEKKITAEACIHHMWFTDTDYDQKGSFIKWNPAVKSANDRVEVIEAIKSNRIDIIATDHAPHTIEEKTNVYTKAPSGGPLAQHALVTLLEMAKQRIFTLEEVVTKVAHNPATLFNIRKRGYIKEGYYADLVLVDLDNPWTVSKENILYKCGWSPFEDQLFHSKVVTTIVNGTIVFDGNEIDETKRGQRLLFDR